MKSLWRKVAIGLVVVATGVAFTSGAQAQAKNPGMGTWKMNPEKSKWSPGPAPKELMATFEPAGKGVKLTTQGVSADGKPTATSYTCNYDGKDCPLTGSPAANTVSLKRSGARTTVRTDKKDGKTVQTLRRVISKDGKSFTVAVKGKTPKGEPINHRIWFDKQ